MKVCHECYADGSLLIACGLGRKRTDHRGSKSRVIRTVLRLDERMGLIDEDPDEGPPDDLLEFKKIGEGHDLLTLEKDGRFLVVIRPRLEEWLLKTARLAHVDIREYGLPDDADALHAVDNDEPDRFSRFLASLKGQERFHALERALRSHMA